MGTYSTSSIDQETPIMTTKEIYEEHAFVMNVLSPKQERRSSPFAITNNENQTEEESSQGKRRPFKLSTPKRRPKNFPTPKSEDFINLVE